MSTIECPFSYLYTSGVIRYFSIQAALTTGMFPAARLSTSAIAIALAVLTSVTLGIIMAGTKM